MELKFTSKKTLILRDGMHAHDIRKNPVSFGLFLNKAKFSQSSEKNLYTITMNAIFIWKWYFNEVMFKLNVGINKMYPFIYSWCDFNVLHARFCHVNKPTLSN